MTEPIKAIVHYNGDVLQLSDEAVRELTAQIEALNNAMPTITIEGVWHAGLIFADSQIVVLDRKAYDGLLNAILKAPIAAKVTGATSDGFHTFDELYEHRHALFLALFRVISESYFVGDHIPWVDDDLNTPGWFLAGIDTPYGQISYHLPDRLRVVAEDSIPPNYKREPYDGYSAADVLKRVQALADYSEKAVQP